MEMEYDEWIAQNPLRKFRKENKITRARISSFLEVASSTVQFWENGSNYPNPGNMGKIANIMDITAEELETMWNNWLEEQPEINISKSK